MNTEQVAKENKLHTEDYIRVIEQRLDGVRQAFSMDDMEIVEVRIKKRIDGLMLIVKRLSNIDGSPEIRFANAMDLRTLLMMLNKVVLSDDGWKEDKPYTGGVGVVPSPLPKVGNEGTLNTPRAGKRVVGRHRK